MWRLAVATLRFVETAWGVSAIRRPALPGSRTRFYQCATTSAQRAHHCSGEPNCSSDKRGTTNVRSARACPAVKPAHCTSKCHVGMRRVTRVLNSIRKMASVELKTIVHPVRRQYIPLFDSIFPKILFKCLYFHVITEHELYLLTHMSNW